MLAAADTWLSVRVTADEHNITLYMLLLLTACLVGACFVQVSVLISDCLLCRGRGQSAEGCEKRAAGCLGQSHEGSPGSD